MSRRIGTMALSAAFAVLCVLPAAAGSGYKLIKTISLPGDKGGHGDWVTFDRQTDTVWLAQSPDHNVVVIDAKTMTVKGVVPGIANGNGIAVTPQYAFLAYADHNDVVVVDKNSLKIAARPKPQGKTPDGVAYDWRSDLVYVACDDSNDMTVFRGKPPFPRIAHIRLRPNPDKDGPDVPTYVGAKKRVYQPVHNVVDVIDPATNTIATIWKPDVRGDTKPMAYDAKTNRLFMGTTDKKMLVLDADSGTVVASIPLKGSADETAIDESVRRAYVGDKAGNEVIDLDTNRVVDTLPSEKNAHTLTVNTTTHDVYVYRGESNKVDVFRKTSTM
jgi:DNA-binding beta-propeller fold protein YncE